MDMEDQFRLHDHYLDVDGDAAAKNCLIWKYANFKRWSNN